MDGSRDVYSRLSEYRDINADETISLVNEGLDIYFEVVGKDKNGKFGPLDFESDYFKRFARVRYF